MKRWPLVVAGLLITSDAQATYSVVGVDTASRQVGGVGTSCVGRFTVYRIYGSVPDVGVVHAQAQLNEQGRQRAVQRLGEGVGAQAIIDEITSAGFDGNASRRQYGVVDLVGDAVPFTGGNNGDHASDRTGRVGSFVYSAQGNILTSRAVIDQASDAFEAEGCDLADRLMRALEAGAVGGEGDSRCTPRGIPSDGAFIQVDRPGEPAGQWLLLRVDDTSPQDPVALLRGEYDRWRQANPCPMPPDAGVPDAGFVDASDLEAGTLFDAGVEDSGPSDGGFEDAGPSDAGRDGGGGIRIMSTSGEVTSVSCGCGIANERRSKNALLICWLLVALRFRRISGGGGGGGADARHADSTRGSS